jgi:CRP-like cAMP-binding protein
MSGLDDTSLQRLQRDLQVQTYEAGTLVRQRAEPTRQWVGVFSGLLLLRGDAERPPGANAVAPGGWVGEDTLGGTENWAEDLVALRKTHVGFLPADTYFWLRERSLGFNHTLLARLERRMRLCRQQLRAGRPGSADERVAQALLMLFDPVLHPAVGHLLRITQEELAEICRLSRQRVNQALQRLSSLGQLRLRYGGIELIAAESLRSFAGHAEVESVAEPGLVAELQGEP